MGRSISRARLLSRAEFIKERETEPAWAWFCQGAWHWQTGTAHSGVSHSMIQIWGILDLGSPDVSHGTTAATAAWEPEKINWKEPQPLCLNVWCLKKAHQCFGYCCFREQSRGEASHKRRSHKQGPLTLLSLSILPDRHCQQTTQEKWIQLAQ